MGKTIFAVLLLLSIAVINLQAGGRKVSNPATLSASCEICSTSDAITYSGSGYKAGATVVVDVQGPVSYSITTKADSGGNIYIDFGAILDYPVGSYIATACMPSGKGMAVVASDSFDVQ